MIKPFSLFLTALTLTAAEPDWPEVDRHAVSFLQSYLRIRSVNPPADTREAAALFRRTAPGRAGTAALRKRPRRPDESVGPTARPRPRKEAPAPSEPL